MFGQLMPLYGGGRKQFIKDPFQSYVIMSLHMEDNGDGFTLVDSSGHNNTFSRSGNAHISAEQKKFGDGSASFDGTGDYYYSAAKSLYSQPGDFTIEFWVYNLGSTVTGQWSGLVSHATSSSFREPSILIEDSSNRLILFNYSNPRITSISSVPLNQWVHISYGRSSGYFYIYIDGNPEGRIANSDDVPQWSCTLGALGWYRTPDRQDKLRGYIDEFRWWKGVSIRDGVTAFNPPKLPWGDV